MAVKYCQNCGNQLQSVDTKFCPKCGSIVEISDGNVNVNDATSPIAIAKTKLKTPAIAIIVNAGINIIICLFFLFLFNSKPTQEIGNTGRLWLAAGNTMYILLIPVFSFCIYYAVQMMNVKKYGFAIASSIITIISSVLTGPLPLIGLPIGIWVLIILLKKEIKAAFSDL